MVENGVDGISVGNTSDSLHPDLVIKMDSNFAKLLFSLICGMAWVIYITYYNSRVTAYIVTRLLTRFYITKGYLSIGKLIFTIFDNWNYFTSNLCYTYYYLYLKIFWMWNCQSCKKWWQSAKNEMWNNTKNHILAQLLNWEFPVLFIIV